MNVPITRIDHDLPLPEYHTHGAVGFDLLARHEVRIPPKSFGLIPNNVIIAIPEGYMLLLTSRSSTARKKGLIPANGVGIIDQDYCGSEDEIKTLFYNTSDTEVIVEKGERLSQCIFVQIGKATWEVKDTIGTPSRGGFGSTDKN